MKLHDYLKDKGSVLLVNAAGLFFLSLFLRLSAVRTGDILIICIFWFLILTIWLAADFYRSRKHFCHLFHNSFSFSFLTSSYLHFTQINMLIRYLYIMQTLFAKYHYNTLLKNSFVLSFFGFVNTSSCVPFSMMIP